MPETPNNSIADAARFVLRLDSEQAEAVLSRLSVDETRALRAAIAELQTEEVGKEPEAAPVEQDSGGVELQLSGAVEPVEEKPTQAIGAEWLRSVEHADPAAIAAYLSSEHPRAVGLVLTCLPAPLAAAVLGEFPTSEQPELLARMSEQGDADPASASVIATGLRDWLEQKQEEAELRKNRLESIRGLIEAAAPADRERLISGLRREQPEVAEAVGGPLLERAQPVATAAPQAAAAYQSETSGGKRAASLKPEDLERLDSRVLAKALGAIDSRTALLALAGASEALLSRVTSGMNNKAARELQRRIVAIGPMRLSDVDRAQSELALAAERLVAARRNRQANSTERTR